ncbi:MAG TPA: Ig-like domain-containing protein, partial [Actinomycetota bacterium]|nr:Ig-like domain-containing protein [Actinomycetota bacterium]
MKPRSVRSAVVLVLSAASLAVFALLAPSAGARVLGPTGAHANHLRTPSPSCDPALTGTSGNDTIVGTAGDDHICGLGGNDVLIGNGGVDIIEGGGGNDLLVGGPGNDTLDGGAGVNTASYADDPNTASQLAVDLSGTALGTCAGTPCSNDPDGGLGHDTLVSIQNAIGSPGPNRIIGDSGANSIDGMGGADTLTGSAGPDVVAGGAGPDQLSGGKGNDTLLGGPGADTMNGNPGADAVIGGSEDDVVRGGKDADTVVGGTGGDTLLGQGGSDLLRGRDGVSGNDTLDGKGGTNSCDFDAGDAVSACGLAAPADNAPVAVDDPALAQQADYQVKNNGQLFVAAPGVLGNDTDADAGDGLTVVPGAGPSHGTLTLFPDGSFLYTPTSPFAGTDTFTYFASDGVAQSATAGTVSIDVQASDLAPTDIQLSNNSIAENQPSGTDIGTLTTTDPDPGDTATYTLPNTGCGGGPFPDNSSFQIGGVSNDRLQSAASFNFEVKSSYTICVRTTDGGAQSFDKEFTISITNVNEPPTDISLSNSSIDENLPSGSAVGNLSQVGDPDSGETYTFTLLTSGCSGSFPDSSSFQISGAQLQSAASFDFETKNSYTICVRVNDPGSPNLSFEKQFTITINDVNDPPVDGDESTSAVGNTLLEYGSVPSPSSAPKKVVSGNLLTNATDQDQPPQTLTISASDSTSVHGGTVSVSSSGAFSYLPAAGYTGPDSFGYTVSDGNGGTDTSTVNITVASRVWYVKNNATAGGTGRSTDPFDTLAEADTAANATGDIIYVYKGDGTTTGLTGGFSLLASQKLLGEPINLVVGADTLATGTPANRPSISGTVALASGSRVEAVDIAGSAGAAIAGTNTGGSDVTNVNLSGGAGGVALTG